MRFTLFSCPGIPTDLLRLFSLVCVRANYNSAIQWDVLGLVQSSESNQNGGIYGRVLSCCSDRKRDLLTIGIYSKVGSASPWLASVLLRGSRRSYSTG